MNFFQGKKKKAITLGDAHIQLVNRILGDMC
jgi:hypothetical protein